MRTVQQTFEPYSKSVLYLSHLFVTISGCLYFRSEESSSDLSHAVVEVSFHFAGSLGFKKVLFCLRKPADIENIDIKSHPTSSSMQSEAQCRRRVLLHVLASRTTRCGQQLASSSPRRWSVVEKNSCWCFLRRYNVSRDAIRNKCRRLAPFLLSVSPVVFSLSFIPCWLAGGGKTAPVLILALIHRKSRFKTIQSVHLSAIMPAHATKEQAQSSGKHQPIDSYLFADFPPEHLWWIDPHMVLSLFLTNWPKNGIGDLLAARILRLG